MIAKGEPPRREPPPAALLAKAMAADSAQARARWALRGLATRHRLDRTVHAMLLRQLYLSYFESGRFEQALEVARQAIEVGVLRDVLHQDAARAALASGDLPAAVVHLRAAARAGPAARKAFHYWTLGSVLFLAGRYAEAIRWLQRAAERRSEGRPLYRAHLALARIAAGETLADLQRTIDDLVRAPCGKGYGYFVLGHLAYAAGSWDEATRYLAAFLRPIDARPALRTALQAEVAMARATMAKMAAKN